MTWRQGRHVPINVYDGDRPVAQFHTAEDAKLVCDAVNALLANREDVPGPSMGKVDPAVLWRQAVREAQGVDAVARYKELMTQFGHLDPVGPDESRGPFANELDAETRGY